MNRQLLLPLVCLCAAAVSPTAVVAQGTPNDVGGLYALTYTPAGALPTVIMTKTARDSASRGWASLRYGRYKYRFNPLSFANYGVSGQVRVWRSLHVGASYAYRTCTSGCSGLAMGSLDASGTLMHKTATVRGEADTEIGFLATAGLGKASKTDITARSVALFLPLSVSLPQSYDGILTLTVLPGIAYGSLVDNTGILFGTSGTFSSARAIFGAGIAYFFPIGLGLHLMVHRVAVEESTTQTGLIASWRF